MRLLYSAITAALILAATAASVPANACRYADGYLRCSTGVRG